MMPSDRDSDLILIICGSGKQASHLLPVLVAQYKHLRLQVGSEASARRLQEAYPRMR